MLRKLALSAAFAATATASLAADLPVRGPAAVPIFTWTGFYIGANVGGAWNSVSQSQVITNNSFFGSPLAIALVESTAASQSLNGSTLTGGLQMGYNWQFNSLVAGIEADINGNASGTKTASSTVVYFPPNPQAFTLVQSIKNDWMGTLRGRLGYAAGPTLFYVTGGLAFGDVSVSRTFSDTIVPGLVQTVSNSNTRTGWTLGAGFEYALSRDWSVKGEYLHADLGRVTNPGPLFPGFPTVMTGSTELRRDIARVGVNYRF
jgi:outer membrane immunogenic protein